MLCIEDDLVVYLIRRANDECEGDLLALIDDLLAEHGASVDQGRFFALA